MKKDAPKGADTLTNEQIDQWAADEAHSMTSHGYILNLTMLRCIVARALATLESTGTSDPDFQSRAMFVARLSSGGPEAMDTMMSCRDVLALLNDCDMLASRAAPEGTSGAVVKEPSEEKKP